MAEGTASEAAGHEPDLEAQMLQHAPPSWRTEERHAAIAEVLESGDRQPMVVLSADIRRSTFLMKEAVSLSEHAATLGALLTYAVA